jgi:hypothetical protein
LFSAKLIKKGLVDNQTDNRFRCYWSRSTN